MTLIWIVMWIQMMVWIRMTRWKCSVPTAVGKPPEVQVEVQSGRVELVPPIHLRRGPRSQITLREEIL